MQSFFFIFFYLQKIAPQIAKKAVFTYTPHTPSAPTAPHTPPRVGPATGTPPTAPTHPHTSREYLRYPATIRSDLGPTS